MVRQFKIKHFILLFFLTACGDSDSEDTPSLNSLSFTINSIGLNSDVDILLGGLSVASLTQSGAFNGTAELLTNTYDITYTSSTNQLCKIAQSNIAITDETSDFTIDLTCLNWVDPLSGSDKISVSSEDASFQQVAISDNGDAVIVWEQSNGSDFQIFMSEYRSGTWTHPASLSDNISPNGQDASAPRVSINASGETIIAWVQFDGSTNQIFMSEYRSGAWTHPADLDDSISVDGQYASNAFPVISDNSEALIVWNQSNGNTDQIFMSEYRSGAWIHPANLMAHISPIFNDANFPKAAINASGESLIVWEQFNGSSHNQIFLSEYRNGTWTHPASASDNISPNGSIAAKPEAEINDSGEALISWIQSDGTNNQIFMSEYRSGWTNPADLNDNISPDGQAASHLQIAMSNSGDASIVWRQSNVANDQIFMSEYRSGAWSHPADLNDNISLNESNATAPDVSMNTTGQTFITWQQLSGLRQQIFRSEYRNGVWSGPADIDDNISLDAQDAHNPKVSCNNEGEALIIWEQQNSGSLQIFLSEHR